MRSWLFVAVLAVRTLSGQPATAPLKTHPLPDLEARKAEVRATIERREFSKALAAVAELNKKIPDDPQVWMLLGEAHLGLGKIEEAEKAAQWMLDLQLGKADPEGYLLVAKIREALKDNAGAMQMVTKAFEATPVEKGAERAGMLRFAARLAAKQGQTAEAARYRAEALKAERR